MGRDTGRCNVLFFSGRVPTLFRNQLPPQSCFFEDGGNNFLWCVGALLPNHTAISTLEDYNLKLYHGTERERESTHLFHDGSSIEL